MEQVRYCATRAVRRYLIAGCEPRRISAVASNLLQPEIRISSPALVLTPEQMRCLTIAAEFEPYTCRAKILLEEAGDLRMCSYPDGKRASELLLPAG
jgi:hypothetical protein